MEENYTKQNKSLLFIFGFQKTSSGMLKFNFFLSNLKNELFVDYFNVFFFI